MKKLSFAFALTIALSLFLSSCKKDIADISAPPDEGHYIKGLKNGIPFNFTGNTLARIADSTSSGGFITLNLVANGTALEGFDLGINFFSAKAIQPGVFREDNASPDYLVAGVYNPNSTVTVNIAGIQFPSVKPLVINILTKSGTEITGTFEGAFYQEGAISGTADSEFILITNGEFKLPISK